MLREPKLGARAPSTVRSRSTEVVIDSFLEEEGFIGSAGEFARSVMEESGLTRAGKTRVASVKLARARELLRHRLARLCVECVYAPEGDGREIVRVPADACEVCAGSRNQRAGVLAGRAMCDAGVRRLLVLGGTPKTHSSLRNVLKPSGVEVRCIDGRDGVRPVATVDADLTWGDVLVIWASTPLPHKVSQLYTARAAGRLRAITIPHRGVEALCKGLVRLLR